MKLGYLVYLPYDDDISNNEELNAEQLSAWKGTNKAENTLITVG